MRPALLLLALGCGGGDRDRTPAQTTPPETLIADAGDDVSGPVGTAILFDGSASVGTTLTWDFGDGTTAIGAVVEHTYSQPGNYTAVIQATAADGSFLTDVAVAVAHNPSLGPSVPANWLVVDADRQPWAAFPEAGVLTKVAENLPAHYSLCGQIGGVSIHDDAMALVCDDTLLVVDFPGLARNYTHAFDAGAHPFSVAHDGVGWVVTLQGSGEVVRVTDGSTREVLDVVPDVRGLAVGTTGRWASQYRSLDGMGVLRGTTSIDLPRDPGPDSDTTIRGVPTAIESLVLSQDEGWLYAGGVLANTERGLYLDGELPNFDTSVRAFVDAVDPTTGEQRWRKQFDDHGMTGPLALSGLGNWLFVGFPTTSDVLILDAYSGDIVSSILGAGKGIRALQVDGDRLYVYAWLDRQVHAYDISDLGDPVREWSGTVGGSEPLSDQILYGKQVFWDAADTRMAKAGYLSCAVCHPDGEHDGMTWDFTDRGEGMRNTTTLLGRAGTGMGPLHWTANFDEVQDFEHDIRGPFAGTGFLNDSQWTTGTVATTLGDPKAGLSIELDALAAYVSSLDQTPASPYRTDAVGEALFVSANCILCHVPPLFTDSPQSRRHDIGTLTPASGQRMGGPLDGLDTPTLLGAWQTPPYLHDGSASTVAQAIAAHQSAAGLEAGEIDALAAYVLSL